MRHYVVVNAELSFEKLPPDRALKLDQDEEDHDEVDDEDVDDQYEDILVHTLAALS